MTVIIAVLIGIVIAYVIGEVLYRKGTSINNYDIVKGDGTWTIIVKSMKWQLHPFVELFRNNPDTQCSYDGDSLSLWYRIGSSELSLLIYDDMADISYEAVGVCKEKRVTFETKTAQLCINDMLVYIYDYSKEDEQALTDVAQNLDDGHYRVLLKEGKLSILSNGCRFDRKFNYNIGFKH